MTIPQFLDALTRSATARPHLSWRCVPRPALLRTAPQAGWPQCPLAFVAQYDTPGARTGGLALGLSAASITAIVCAADEAPGHDPWLRTALFHAVGLGGGTDATITT